MTTAQLNRHVCRSWQLTTQAKVPASQHNTQIACHANCLGRGLQAGAAAVNRHGKRMHAVSCACLLR